MFRTFLGAAAALALLSAPALPAEKRPFRGAVKMSVLLCKYKNAPTPAKNRQFYENMLTKAGTGGHADFWNQISDGSITLKGSVVRGWYTLDQTEAEARAYGGGGSPDRVKKFTDCVNKAKSQGYTVPNGHVTIVVTSPGIDTFGMGGGAFLGENVSVGTAGHEVGHGLQLNHSFSSDSSYCNATWASQAEYDDQWDLMSFANVFSKNIGDFGSAGPRLNAYHMDRMGWLDRRKILRFGADGRYDRTVTLRAATRTGSGYRMVRIPFDPTDLDRYFTIEYRLAEGWDSAIGGDRILIHEIENYQATKCSTGVKTNRGHRSYLQRATNGDRLPHQSINRNGVRIDLVSKNPAAGTARVRIRSTRPQLCIQGYVWREARSSDRVCVPVARRTQVREENRLAASRRSPNGGAYGPDTCKQGYVWREAYSGDRVCVPPSSRTRARNENRVAWEKRIGGAVYGPNTCKSGYVWREADFKDWVCVSPSRRAEVRTENSLAASRRSPNGGAYGPDTCRQGFVWREAFPGDHVCVPRSSRSKAWNENKTAHDRLKNKGA